jgi:ketosteroid isomerase-like protein
MRNILPCILVALTLTAAAAAPESSDTAAIRALEEQWDAANLKGDAAALDRILANEFILTGDDGKVHTKTEVLSELKSRNISYQSAKTEELKIILHGNAAVVSGRWRGNYKNHGRNVNLLERFTNFYVRQGGRWQCVASHGSAIK